MILSDFCKYRYEEMLQKSLEAYWEPHQISKTELFAKVVNGFKSLTIFPKPFIVDVWKGSDYTSGRKRLVGAGDNSRLFDKWKWWNDLKLSVYSVTLFWKNICNLF